MTELLVKHFIKDPENVTDKTVRENYGVLSSIVGVVSNIILFLIKFIVGIVIGSVAVTADSFNNLSDSMSSIISLYSFKASNKPADKEHPFGHGRMEYVATLAIAFIMGILAFEFTKTSIMKIINPEEMTFSITSLLLLIVTVLIKIWQSSFNKTIGTKINSQVLLATAKDSMNDVYITISTIISIVFWKLTNINIDGYIGLLVSLFLFMSAYNILKDTLSPLMGESVDADFAKELHSFIVSYDGILDTHDLIMHNYGPNTYLATIHVEVPKNIPVDVSHETIDKIEYDVKEKFGVHLTIHMDPVDLDDKRIDDVKALVLDYVKDYPTPVIPHDFRIVCGSNNSNIIFDIEVPHDFSDKDVTALRNNLCRIIKESDPTYTAVINIEYGYVFRK